MNGKSTTNDGSGLSNKGRALSIRAHIDRAIEELQNLKKVAEQNPGRALTEALAVLRVLRYAEKNGHRALEGLFAEEEEASDGPTCVVLYRTNLDGIVLARADDERKKIVLSGNAELESLTEGQLRSACAILYGEKGGSDMVFRDASGEKPDRTVRR